MHGRLGLLLYQIDSTESGEDEDIRIISYAVTFDAESGADATGWVAK